MSAINDKPTMKAWDDDYRTMLDDCMNRETRMSEWEQGFIQSLDEQLDRGNPLTSKQLDKLNQIWEKVTTNG